MPGILSIWSWAPDGKHLVVDDFLGRIVVDDVGAKVLDVDASDVGWLNPSTLALFGVYRPGPATGQVRFVDIAGNETGRLDDEFTRMVVSVGNNLLAVVPPSAGDNQGTSYRLWDNGVLSEPRQGQPLAWSADGSLLAILIPSADGAAGGVAGTTTGTVVQAGDPGDQGTLAIVDRTGRQILHVADWIASTYEDVLAFSPDDRYLAACLHDPNDLPSAPTIRVIDVQTGSLSDALPNACAHNGTGWADSPRLFVSDAINVPHLWTSEEGAEGVGIADNYLVTPALNGNLAVWSDGSPDSTLELRVGDSIGHYSLPGLREVQWSPDGTVVAAISIRNGSDHVWQLVLIPVATTPPAP